MTVSLGSIPPVQCRATAVGGWRPKRVLEHIGILAKKQPLEGRGKLSSDVIPTLPSRATGGWLDPDAELPVMNGRFEERYRTTVRKTSFGRGDSTYTTRRTKPIEQVRMLLCLAFGRTLGLAHRCRKAVEDR
jgi:hypothetical protein